MKQTLKNLTSRLVSFRCNSGEYRHLPPRVAVELPSWEVEKNQMIEKLVARGSIKKIDAAESERGEGASPAPASGRDESVARSGGGATSKKAATKKRTSRG